VRLSFVKLIFLLLFFLFSFISFPQETSAQFCTGTITIESPLSPCSCDATVDQCFYNSACVEAPQLKLDCTAVSFLCSINPFCRKYTGEECCTTPVSSGGLGYESCQGDTWIDTTCPRPYRNTFRCCSTSPPLPTPTPSQPGCTTFILADGSPPCVTKQFNANCTVALVQPGPFTGNECVLASFPGQVCVQTSTIWTWTGERCPGPTPTPSHPN
jgi:hypothetical protein